MRNTVSKAIFNVFLIVLCLFWCAAYTVLYAQQVSAFSVNGTRIPVPETLLSKVSVQYDKALLHDVLQDIARKGNFKLNYSSDRVPVSRKISLPLQKDTAFNIIQKVLKNTGTNLVVTDDNEFIIIPFRTKAPKYIQGMVIDAKSKKPLEGVNVVVLGTKFGAATNSEGKFSIVDSFHENYVLEASMLGYKKIRKFEQDLPEGGQDVWIFELVESLGNFKEIVVTTGRFSLMHKQPVTRQTLSYDEIQNIPKFGEDIYRTVSRLPGLTSIDFSSRFNIRGGTQDEVLVLLDGMELHDPFHLKDIDGGGVSSIIDADAVGGIELMTGAFPAEYGDRLSGVFSLKTSDPKMNKTSIGVSFTNARFLTEGVFDEGKGSWMVSGRKGYIDLILNLNDEGNTITPKYYDTIGKIEYKLSNNHSISAHILAAFDKLDLYDRNTAEDADTDYQSKYNWFTLKSTFTPKLFARTLFYAANLNHDRRGTDTEGIIEPGFTVEDYSNFQWYGVKQDWTYEISDRFLINSGFDLKKSTADYSYFKQVISNREGINYNRGEFDFVVKGKSFSTYLSSRIGLLEPLVLELGGRLDHVSWVDDNVFSPRTNLAYSLRENTVLRLGWGKFNQFQGINQLAVTDGEDYFHPAEKSQHNVVGLEHAFESGLSMRVEGYLKKISSIRPRYYTQANPFDTFFPEVSHSRIALFPEKGTAKGLEFFVKKDSPGKFYWWGSYNLSSTDQKIRGEIIPHSFDQRHTVYFDFNVRPNPKWLFNLAWEFHTGTPFTPSTVDFPPPKSNNPTVQELFNNRLNSERYPAYHRMDFRVNRYFDKFDGRFSFFFEILNLYNRKNVFFFRKKFFGLPDGSYEVRDEEHNFFSILPSLGLKWER